MEMECGGGWGWDGGGEGFRMFMWMGVENRMGMGMGCDRDGIEMGLKGMDYEWLSGVVGVPETTTYYHLVFSIRLLVGLPES